MPRPLDPVHGPLQILHVLGVHGARHILRQQRPRQPHCARDSLELQPAQRGGHQVILPGQPRRQQVDGDEARERQQGAHVQRQADGIQQVAAQLARHVGDLEGLDVAVPVGPEVVERGRPHVGRHAQRGAVDGGLAVQRLHLVVGEAAEEGVLHGDEGDKERGRRPLVQLRVVGVVAVALDVPVVRVDDGEDGPLVVGRPVHGGVEEARRVLQPLRDARGEARV